MGWYRSLSNSQPSFYEGMHRLSHGGRSSITPQVGTTGHFVQAISSVSTPVQNLSCAAPWPSCPSSGQNGGTRIKAFSMKINEL